MNGKNIKVAEKVGSHCCSLFMNRQLSGCKWWKPEKDFVPSVLEFIRSDPRKRVRYLSPHSVKTHCSDGNVRVWQADSLSLSILSFSLALLHSDEVTAPFEGSALTGLGTGADRLLVWDDTHLFHLWDWKRDDGTPAHGQIQHRHTLWRAELTSNR